LIFLLRNFDETSPPVPLSTMRLCHNSWQRGEKVLEFGIAKK